MKPLFSEEYYRQYWDRFMEPTIGEHYMNLEGDLEKEMRVYVEIGLPNEAVMKIKQMKAEEIAKRCYDAIIEDKPIVQEIINKSANFGYTTQRQESNAQYRFRTRFDFNCLQLRDFKVKYEL